MKTSFTENKLDNDKQNVTEKMRPQQRRRFVKMRGLYPKGGPKIVREEFERLGFICLPRNAPNGSNQINFSFLLLKNIILTEEVFIVSERCDAFWVMRFSSEEFQRLRPYQSVNFFPGMTELCLKSKLHDNLTRMKTRYSHEVFTQNGFFFFQSQMSSSFGVTSTVWILAKWILASS